jgi:hypothetical protein
MHQSRGVAIKCQGEGLQKSLAEKRIDDEVPSAVLGKEPAHLLKLEGLRRQAFFNTIDQNRTFTTGVTTDGLSGSDVVAEGGMEEESCPSGTEVRLLRFSLEINSPAPSVIGVGFLLYSISMLFLEDLRKILQRIHL